jgi:hypothetical protein
MLRIRCDPPNPAKALTRLFDAATARACALADSGREKAWPPAGLLVRQGHGAIAYPKQSRTRCQTCGSNVQTPASFVRTLLRRQFACNRKPEAEAPD